MAGPAPTDVGGVVQGSAPLKRQSVTGRLAGRRTRTSMGARTTLTRSATLIAGVVEVG